MSPDPTLPDDRIPSKTVVRTRTPRPDELTRETFEFIAAIDEYKRRHMRSFLNDEEVLEVLFSLGYALAEDATDADGPRVTEDRLRDFSDARLRYRAEHGRLFPTWSEVFELLRELGYERVDEADEADQGDSAA